MQKLDQAIKNKKKDDITTEEPKESTESVTDVRLSTEDINQKGLSIETEHIEILPETLKNEEVFHSGGFGGMKPILNGHARPTAVTERSTTTIPSLIPSKLDYSDEPWRPIIPSYRDVVRIKSPSLNEYSDKVFEDRYGPAVEHIIDDDAPITFSKESYIQNLRVNPDYAGNGDPFQIKNSRVTEKEPVNYKDYPQGSALNVSEGVLRSDDVITAPPEKSTNIVVISEMSTLSTLSTSYNATKLVASKENPEKKMNNPLGVDQILSSISVIENNLNLSSQLSKKNEITTPKSSGKTRPNIGTVTTPKEATIKAVLRIEPTVNSKLDEPMPERKPIAVTERLGLEASNLKEKEVINTSQRPTSVLTSTEVSASTEKINRTIENPFADDSRSSSSNYNFGLPDLPILKQFQNLDSLFQNFPKTSSDIPKYSSTTESTTEATATRFPVRTKQTTPRSNKKEESIYVEVSTILPEHATNTKPTFKKPVAIRGEVEVVSGPVHQEHKGPTTETPKLVTLLPVRSNVNMMRPLRPRPKSNLNVTLTAFNRRKSKSGPNFKTQSTTNPYQLRTNPKQLVNDKNGKRWVYYSSPSLVSSTPLKPEKLFIVTPEPRKESLGEQNIFDFAKNLTTVPLYNTIETLLNIDYRNRNGNQKVSTVTIPEEKKEFEKKNTSEIVNKIVKIMDNVAISTGESPNVIIKMNQTLVNKTSE